MAGGLLAALAYHTFIGKDGTPIGGSHPWSTTLLALAFLVCGTAVAGRIPSNPLGWLLLGIALAATLDTVSWVFASHWEPAGWVSQAAWWPAISLPVLLLLLFPTGRLPSRRWRGVLWAAVLGIALPTIGLVALAVMVPARLNDPLVPLHGGEVDWLRVTLLAAGLSLAAACAAVASLIGRWRSSTGVERQQLEWLGSAVIVAFLCLAVDKEVGGIGYVGLALIPVALAIAILRFRLYDLDLYLNRALVYGSLTGGLVLFYVLVVGLVVAAFGHAERLGPSLLATGAVAVVFQPARHWLQRRVDRLVYGDRGDPFRVVAALGRSLGDVGNPEEVLGRVVGTISSGLQLPFAAVELTGSRGPTIAASHGRRIAEPVAFPMVYEGARVGSLLVVTRSPADRFSTAESRLLETLADQVGPVAKSVALTTELRRSRERVVRSREEERRRLRRDLHDGLGPILSGLRLGLEGIARRLPPETELVEAVGRLGTQAVAGRDEVRRLIDDLRPGVLDSLGIVGAIEDAAARFPAARPDGRRVRFGVEAYGLPNDLPAAVEVAAYWIVTEAMHNVVRHANADRCTVSLSRREDHLEVLVEDDGDGIGFPGHVGVGLGSMVERAEEIGGRCSIENGPQGGTRVLAHLPVCPSEPPPEGSLAWPSGREKP
jgi:signal transduction histidine kinase